MTTYRWILAIALAGFMGFMAIQKFGAENIVFAEIAKNSGIAWFDPQIRMLTGSIELLCAVLLLFPRTRLQGAQIILLVLIGAIGFHLSPWLGVNVPGIGPSLFIMALGACALTLAVILLERKAQTVEPT